MLRSSYVFGCVAATGLLGCNAILDIKEHDLASGALDGGSAGLSDGGKGGGDGATFGGGGSSGSDAGANAGGARDGGKDAAKAEGGADASESVADGSTGSGGGGGGTNAGDGGALVDASDRDASANGLDSGAGDARGAGGMSAAEGGLGGSGGASGAEGGVGGSAGTSGSGGSSAGNPCATANCSTHATCAVSGTSFTCTCTSGFTGDGVTCADVDECTSGANNCHAKASCTNTSGSFTCACEDGYSGDGVTCVPNSCAGMTANCGPSSNESCCGGGAVAGGTFYRSYDGVSFTDNSHPATISTFALDRFEVTVGRFRNFVAAWQGGWRPAQGAGKHTHLNGGSGLVDGSASPDSTYESGWKPAWVSSVKVDDTTLTACTAPTWTSSAGPASTENLPVNCVGWYAAYAFCAWDGGFLPSEAEWNYAASGGSQQRQLPWGDSFDPGCSELVCSASSCSSTAPALVGSKSPAGDGRFGQADLAGNLPEWTIDWMSTYPLPCTDCAVLTGSFLISVRGGGFASGDLYDLRPSTRNQDSYTNSSNGFRCGRAP